MRVHGQLVELHVERLDRAAEVVDVRVALRKALDAVAGAADEGVGDVAREEEEPLGGGLGVGREEHAEGEEEVDHDDGREQHRECGQEEEPGHRGDGPGRHGADGQRVLELGADEDQHEHDGRRHAQADPRGEGVVLEVALRHGGEEVRVVGHLRRDAARRRVDGRGDLAKG